LENVVAEENYCTENTFNGVANDVTYPIKLVVLPIEGVQVTTVDYSKSIKKDGEYALLSVDDVPPEIKFAFTLTTKFYVK
jgi:hypothetical protein